jgi:hypothetical protein
VGKTKVMSLAIVWSYFHSLRESNSPMASEIYKLVSNINTFRNDYVAHQNKDLTDSALARKALQEWASGLLRIWSLHG